MLQKLKRDPSSSMSRRIKNRKKKRQQSLRKNFLLHMEKKLRVMIKVVISPKKKSLKL